jgi:hypothetical protein
MYYTERIEIIRIIRIMYCYSLVESDVALCCKAEHLSRVDIRLTLKGMFEEIRRRYV